MFNENIIKWVTLFHLVLANDINRIKAILEVVYTVSESANETIIVLGFTIELPMFLQGTSIES
jgi:hypothetical protein